MIATALAALLALQAPAAQPPTSSPTATLISLYETTSDTETREAIIRFLGERGDEAATAKIISIAKGDADTELREEAIRQLADGGGEARTTMLLQMRRRTSTSWRRCCATSSNAASRESPSG